ncbi:MAG: mannonate dehydratase [Bacteroidota bacterium]
MKKLEQTWRWFGSDDPVSLASIRQVGATGIVTALHHIPNGEVWPITAIEKQRDTIKAAGLRWSVVESLPVSEAIKKQTTGWRQHITNYQESLRHLAQCGIYTVTYNFMPVLDWTRTQLDYTLPNEAQALRFDKIVFAAFELFILERPGAQDDYDKFEIDEARKTFATLPQAAWNEIIQNVIAGLPGAEEGYTLEEFRATLNEYAHIGPNQLRQHLIDFLRLVTPVAEEVGIKLVIHPDDPPYPILGLPRVVSTAVDLEHLFTQVPSPSNGLCFCTGSFGVRPDNDLPSMVRQFAERIHFIHLRSTIRDAHGNFYEANHLDGDVDMFAVMAALLEEQQKRQRSIPMRPDHGHKMLDDLHKTTNPGYSAIGRLKGLAELRGLEYGILRGQKDVS